MSDDATPTPEEIARIYLAAVDSVKLIAAGKPDDVSDAEWADTVRRNQEHLTYISAKSWWEGSGYDIAALIAGADTTPPALVVSMRQARLALLNAGLLDAVEAAIKAADKATQICWDTSTEVHRDDAVLAHVASTLGLTDVQIDNLFAAGKGL